MGTVWRQAPAITDRQTYEQYAVTTAIELVRELINMIDACPAETREQQKSKTYNINRAYSALGDLNKISI